MRISSQAQAITDEINDCIEACKRDLQQVGVNNLDESDALIIRAITIYCKAEFGYSDKAQQFRQSYDSLKIALSLMEEYQTVPGKYGHWNNGTGRGGRRWRSGVTKLH